MHTRGSRTRSDNLRGGTVRGSALRGGTLRGGTLRGGGSNSGRHPAIGNSNHNGNRDGRRPNHTIKVPPEYERETFNLERETMATLWKTETGCEIVPQTTEPRRLIITSFDIFGAGSNLTKATQKIEEWIRSSKTKSPSTTVWARTPAYDPKAWGKEYTEQLEQQRKLQFTKEMPIEWKSIYKSPITIDWPNDLKEAGVTMKDTFGTGLVKLDSIRKEHEVFIKPVGLHQLEILGSDINRVRLAQKSLLILLDKVRSKIGHVVWPNYIILDSREGSEDGVVFEQAAAWWPDRITHPLVPRLLRCAMTSTMRSNPREYWQDLGPSQYYSIQTTIQRALDIARYEKGHFDFSIRLGCLALKEHNLKVCSTKKVAKFSEDVTNLDCSVKNWLADTQEGEELLTRLMAANHLLEPVATGLGGFGSVDTPSTLFETKPILRGSWVFKDPNGSLSNYVAQVHWTIDETGLYEKEITNFYRLAPEKVAPRENLDIKLMELGESKGWGFNLTSMDPISSQLVPAALYNFAEQVQLRVKHHTTSTSQFVKFNVSESLTLKTGRTDKIYTFGIRNTGYKLECIAMWYPHKDTPCWGLRVYHNEWRSHLAILEQLRLGERAAWGDTVQTFLPDDGYSAGEVPDRYEPETSEKTTEISRDGIRILLVKLMEISQVVFHEKGTDLSDYPAITPSPVLLA